MHDIMGPSANGVKKTAHRLSVIEPLTDDSTVRMFAALDFPPVADFPKDAQFKLSVIGNSVDKIAQDGDTLLCVRSTVAGGEPQDGDLAVIELRGSGESPDGEVSRLAIRRLRRIGGLCEFRHVSNDPAFQEAPLILDMRLDDGTIRIVGKVLFTCRRLGA